MGEVLSRMQHVVYDHHLIFGGETCGRPRTTRPLFVDNLVEEVTRPPFEGAADSSGNGEIA